MASCPVVTFMPITWFMLGVFLSLDERDSTAMHGSALQVADLLCELFCNVTRLVSVVHDDLPPCESSVSLILTGYALYSQLFSMASGCFCSGRICFQNKVFVWAYEYPNEGSCGRLVWNSQYFLRKYIYLFVSSLC